MTHSEFRKIVDNAIERIKITLQTKQQEYATDDALHNFKEKITDNETESPSQVAWGYMRKHLVSIKDLINGTKRPTPLLINEKIGDAVNYLILLEALFYESLAETKPSA